MPRVLIVANETVGADELLAEVRRLDDVRTSDFYVAVPARPLHELHGAVWTQDGAQAAAQERLESTLRILEQEGCTARGAIGDTSPVDAVRDALLDFEADLIMVSTHPEGRSTWLRRGVVDKIRNRFGVPVVHIVSHVRTPASR